MPIINIVAIIDEHSGLGHNNQLLCHLPADLKYFKELTLGKPVIMGRKTFTSIGKLLPGRLNIIVSKTLSTLEGGLVVPSFAEALAATRDTTEVMVIGGATLFAEVLPQAQRLYITLIHHHFAADVFFPPIDEEIWACKEARNRPHDEKNPYDLTFLVYERKKVFDKKS
jgi:dihydrofolate reductase